LTFLSAIESLLGYVDYCSAIKYCQYHTTYQRIDCRPIREAILVITKLMSDLYDRYNIAHIVTHNIIKHFIAL